MNIALNSCHSLHFFPIVKGTDSQEEQQDREGVRCFHRDKDKTRISKDVKSGKMDKIGQDK